MLGPPVPPENVRLVDPHGNEWPCDVVYEGTVAGVHRWRATPLNPTAPVTAGWSMTIGLLPGGTEVSVPLGD
jgi:hypothetical protein